jgi:hypothetical protein
MAGAIGQGPVRGGTGGDGTVTSSVAEASFADLVTTATVGLSRRPLLAGAGRGDEADALLGAAALHAVARRAGTLPASGVTPPPPPCADEAPELPRAAAAALGQALSDAGLLADLLAASAAAGFRMPAPLLPHLLDAAVRNAALRPAVNAAIGARGRWLARHRPAWLQVTAEPGTAEAAGNPRAWETGRPGERVAYLTALRGRDPGAARELLAAGWPRETAAERARLIGVLARGLSLDDEDFLEAALDDRSWPVTEAARDLLRTLPSAQFSRRAALRAASALSLTTGGGRRRLAASPPPDMADLARDGIASAFAPGAQMNEKSWRLMRVIAGVPPVTWCRRFGLEAREIVSVPVQGKLGMVVLAGWRLAAVRFRSPEWADALLSGDVPLPAPDWPRSVWAGDRDLAAVLDPATRSALAVGVFTRAMERVRELSEARGDQHQPGGRAPVRQDKRASEAASALVAELAAWPGPWPAALADLVMDLVAMATGSVQASQPPQIGVRLTAAQADSRLVASAARNVPVTGPRDYAADLARLSEGPVSGLSPAVLRQAAETVSVRRAFQAGLRR